MNQIDQIKLALQELEISLFSITATTKESVELYFIKKSLDMRRMNQVTDLQVTVYRDFDANGNRLRGSSTTLIHETMSYEEIKNALSTAYYAASFVCNPYYELPSGTFQTCVTMPSQLMEQPLESSAMQFAQALYAPDKAEDVFINSAEFFATKRTVHIVTSQGIDVSYVKASVSGEFVTQCVAPADVETYKSFQYNDLELDAMTLLAQDALNLSKSRAVAVSAPTTGTYDIILSDEQVETMLSYYVHRSYSDYIYPGYSNYRVGTNVQGDDISGEHLNIQLKATVPYSAEGIPMNDQPLITDGVLNVIQGNSRFAHYLDIPAIGHYDSLCVSNGTISMDDMKQNNHLHIVNFSDFQMDALSGDFAGEIRLAFLYDGTTITPVTGGSISGNIKHYHNQLIFSKERQVRADFDGPLAMLLKGVQVSGC